MTLIQYYLFANAYILAFWLFYRYLLKDMILFRSIRIYLNSALVLSLLLPFIQSGLSSLLSNSRLIYNSNISELPALGFIYSYEEALTPVASSAVNWLNMLGALLLLGGFIIALLYLVNHIRIKSIVRRAEKQSIPGTYLKVVKSHEVNVPFIYNKTIVLPASILPEEIPIILHHEVLHYSLGHRFDNLLFSFCHILFWVNPFHHLLKASLKLNHEYQVDGLMLSSGADPTFYKLSLIKYSVGSQKFSLANGMSSSKIRSRLLKINAYGSQKGKWRFYLLLPLLILSLALFSLACVQKDVGEDLAEVPRDEIPEDESPADSVHMKIIQITDENLPEIKKGEVIVVLMNRNSQLMVAGEKNILPEAVEDKIISEYTKLLESGLDVRIALQKDVQTDMVEYQKLLDHIATALYKLRNIHAWRIYGSNFDSLTMNHKEVVKELVPFEIFSSKPKDMGRRSAGSQ